MRMDKSKKLFTPTASLAQLVPNHHGYARRYEACVSGLRIKQAWDDFDDTWDDLDLRRECSSISELVRERRLQLTRQAIDEFYVIDETTWFEYNDYTTGGYQLWGYPDIIVVLLVTGKAL